MTTNDEQKNEKKTEISFYVDAEILEEVNRLCDSSGRGIDEVMEEILSKGLEATSESGEKSAA